MVSQRAHQSFLLQDVVVPVFTRVPVIQTPLGTHNVQHLVKTLQSICECHAKFTCRQKPPGTASQTACAT